MSNHFKGISTAREHFAAVRPWLLPAIAAVALQLPVPCLAGLSVTAAGVAGYEYDSNVFDLQSGFPVPGTSDYQKSDWLRTYGASLDVDYLWSQQKLFVNLSTLQYNFDHFTQLNHNEYSADGGWKWQVGPAVDGTLEVLQDHSMVPFTSVNDGEFVLQTERRESGSIDLHVAPEWRLAASGYYRTIDQTFTDLPSLDLKESLGQLALKYLGVAGVTSGLSVGYTAGDYTGQGASTYRQTTVEMVTTYQAAGHSSFDGSLGYSNRTSTSDLNTVSGVTGVLRYVNQLTGKTSLELDASRVINSYVANVGSEIDTAAGASVRWQATRKLGVMLAYTWTQRDLPGQGDAPVGSDRLDHLQYASLNIDYEPREWISIRPYVTYQTRSSNFTGANFNATVAGLYFTLRLQSPRQTTQTPPPPFPPMK